MSAEEDTTPPQQVDQILNSPQLVRALASDRYKQLLDRAPVAIAVSQGAGPDQVVVYVNAAFEHLTGIARADVEGKTWSCLDGFQNDDDATLTLGRAIAEGEDFIGVFRPVPNPEQLIIVQAYASVIESEDGAESFRVAALVDVGGRERAALEQYEIQIRERDTLMRELQHRVKNNLQLITALIRLEARSAAEGESVALARLAGRIDALSVLYRILSAEDTEGDIDLGQYLSDIAAAVVTASAMANITCETDVVYCPVSVNIAMPVGLLVNEMLTNALKYAFVGRATGKLKIICKVENARISVVVSDDGLGMPDNVVWPAPRKLGALILQTLKENAKNVEFEVASIAGQGTFLTLKFDRGPVKATN
jgi:PAS domain S-box-containing protein